jgi:hypothetical protein
VVLVTGRQVSRRRAVRLVAAWLVVPLVLAAGVGVALLLDARGAAVARDVAYVVTCALLPVVATAGWYLSGSDLGESLLGGLLASSLGIAPCLMVVSFPLAELGQRSGGAILLVAGAAWLGVTMLAGAGALVGSALAGRTRRVVALALLVPLSPALAAAAVWWADGRGLTGVRDAAYVLAAVLVPLSVVPALHAATPDRTDVVVYRTSEGAIAFGLAAALLPMLAAWAGHGFGAVTIGVAAGVWFVLGWVGVFRNQHLIPDTYGPDGWAPW